MRIKFTNELPTGAGGRPLYSGGYHRHGRGHGSGSLGPVTPQNRATLHLHGGNTPWISDGTPHQWTTPAGESTPYPKGVSVHNVPDMPDPGPGSLTFFYTNQQSARLMFYHDHAYGITRLNVYAGEAAGYLLTDPVEQALVNGGADPRQPDSPGHPGQDLRARHNAGRPTRRAGSHLGRSQVGRLRQSLVPARLHAEPGPIRQQRRKRLWQVGLRSLVLASHEPHRP